MTNSEGHGQEHHNQDHHHQDQHHQDHHHQDHHHQDHHHHHHRNSQSSHGHGHSQGHVSHHEHDDTDDKHSMYSEVKSRMDAEEEEGDDGSSRGSIISMGHHAKSQHQHIHHDKPADKTPDEHKHSKGSIVFSERHRSQSHHSRSYSQHSHVRFQEKKAAEAAKPKSMGQLPPLPPGVKPRSISEPDEDMSDRASWTTSSFTELTDAMDELTNQHHPSTDTHFHNLTEAEKKLLARGSAADLHSILVKHGQHGSILTKYLRPTMTDEGTQAGVPSWDWLTRLEQMLIHFFLMVFESTGDSSKLIMEMLSTEAGAQIEEIFQLLLKAEPDMYKDLGHLVALAEKWLIHWRGDSEKRQKAIEYVRLYMQGVKDKNYYMLPVQVRLHKLGAFIAGLKVMGNNTPGSLVPIRYPVYNQTHPPAPIGNQFRAASPRVKPATHFSQVVANILCGRPCNDPLPKATVYADKLGRNVFKNTLHGDKEFKTYTDTKYGRFYQRRELFNKDGLFPNVRAIELDAAGDLVLPPADRQDCIENLHCWIPKYTKSYVNTLENQGCEVLAKADFEKSRKVKECRLGKGPVAYCKSIKITAPNKQKKLYDWVRGADGKVHRRLVGSYTEVGRTASMSTLMGETDPGMAGLGMKFGKKGKTGFYPKAVSDTRLGSAGNRPHEAGRKSHFRGRSKSRAFDDLRRKSKHKLEFDELRRKSKHKFEFDEQSKKSRNTNPSIYKIDGISIDGSGDSGQEDENIKKAKKLASEEKPIKKGDISEKPPAGKSSRFGTNYQGPSNYKPRSHKTETETVDPVKGGKNVRGGRGRASDYNSSGPKEGRRGRGQDGTGTSGDYTNKDKGFQNIFKKDGKFSNRPFKKFKKGRYPGNDEWGGEGYGGWSPGDSDYNYDEKDNKKENAQMLTINQCWEKASKLLKKPSKALVIPPAENLMMYLEKKFPKAKWPRGDAIASRDYPNGSAFVSHYKNGSSKVFYPHGGLAVAISGPSPATSQVLVVRDPSDQVFFFDKALLAELNSNGKGTIYDEDGVIKAQYSPIGGFRLDNLEKGTRWHWNHGGQRMLMKLNKYMSVRISDQDKIYLSFFGNHRGFLVNVANGQGVSLMNTGSKATKTDPVINELRQLLRPATQEDTFDYIRGRFVPRPTLGFVDKAKHYENAERDAMGRSEYGYESMNQRSGSTGYSDGQFRGSMSYGDGQLQGSMDNYGDNHLRGSMGYGSMNQRPGSMDYGSMNQRPGSMDYGSMNQRPGSLGYSDGQFRGSMSYGGNQFGGSSNFTDGRLRGTDRQHGGYTNGSDNNRCCRNASCNPYCGCGNLANYVDRFLNCVPACAKTVHATLQC